jgi:LDH2 family malate/lactate/ureidoglycolate dehydrogenase
VPSVDPDALRIFATQVIAATGTPLEQASIIGNSLVDANLAGHDSHGVQRLPAYVVAAAEDDIFAEVVPVIEKIDRATVIIDAGWGWGQPAFRLCVEKTAEQAKVHGVAVGVVHRCYHVGRVAPYVEYLARQGFVAIAMSNAFPAVAPYGGYERVFGTNPMAWAVPRGEGKDPISFDIATSGTAEGKLQVAVSKGLDIPPGLLVDVDGNPSTDPQAFYDGGALLPFGNHKGYGYLVLAQLLGRGLAGLDTTKESPAPGKKRKDGPRGSNGPVVIAIDANSFNPFDDFTAQINQQCDIISASKPAPGFDKVYLPGELELINAKKRSAEGIPLPDKTWEALTELAGRLKISTEGLLLTTAS